MKRPEILAPVGSPDSLYAAVRSGADAVYMGCKIFNARKKADNFGDEEIKNAIDSVAKKLGEDGRILVRASGTEPLIRVMLEGKNIKEIAALAEDVAAVIKSKG